MGKVNRARWIGASTLAAMFLVGEAALLNPRGNYEWFPFYSWSMFALVPDVERNYLVQIKSSDGEAIDFRNAGPAVSDPDSLEAYHLIQRWGSSFERGQNGRAEQLRRAFEDRYLRNGTRYRLFARQEDPLTIWKERSGPAPHSPEAEAIGPWWEKTPRQPPERAAP